MWPNMKCSQGQDLSDTATSIISYELSSLGYPDKELRLLRDLVWQADVRNRYFLEPKLASLDKKVQRLQREIFEEKKLGQFVTFVLDLRASVRVARFFRAINILFPSA